VKACRNPVTPNQNKAADTEGSGAQQLGQQGNAIAVAATQLHDRVNTIGDLRFSISRDDWQASVFINNLTDERAQYTINTGQYEWGMANLADGRPRIQRIFTSRPREFGVQFTKRWE